jgi:hypothetical protein
MLESLRTSCIPLWWGWISSVIRSRVWELKYLHAIDDGRGLWIPIGIELLGPWLGKENFLRRYIRSLGASEDSGVSGAARRKQRSLGCRIVILQYLELY